jgi:ubiquitin carboxyl-terminal hydrolase L5
MSRKRGIKRKSPDSDPDAPLAPPDRDAWPGWVEMESEPAFFNVMLNEMGARGVKVQEIWGLEDDDLVTLPYVIHSAGK